MTFDQARQQPRRAGDELVAAAAYLAAGWRFLTIDGLTVDCEADLETYNEVSCAFDEAAAGREHRYAATSSRLTQGCPLPVLQKITGHRSLRAPTEHYPGPSPEGVRVWYDYSDPAARRRHGASG